MDAHFSSSPTSRPGFPSPTSPSPSPDDLLVLLAVARTGRHTSAAHTLGINHTTVARRIAALESALGGPLLARGSAGWVPTALGERALQAAEAVETTLEALDGSGSGASRLSGVIRLSATDGFSAFVAAPAMAEMRREHPDVGLEIVAVTRRAPQHRVGADLEVVVGRPQLRRGDAVRLAEYSLRLYATREFLREHGEPRSVADLAGKPLVYFIDSLLHVDALDEARRVLPDMFDAVTSTNVFVHVEATVAGAGFGLLPAFLADREEALVRVLSEEVERRLPYWLVARPGVLEQPLVSAYLEHVRARLAEVRGVLLGEVAR